jgi:mRNA interferase RelE/StbE
VKVEQLAKLPRPVQVRIDDAIHTLAELPRPPGAKELVGLDAYRVRVGEYRIVYEVHDRVLVVLVLAVGDRREIYKRLKG